MRSTNLRSWLLVAAVLFVALTGAVDASAKNGKGRQSPATVPFTVLDTGEISGIDTGENVTIRDQASWETLWARHKAGSPPAVDFTQEIVIAVFLGLRGADAYSVHIDRVVELEPLTGSADEADGLPRDYGVDYVEVEYEGIASDWATTPFVIAVVPHTEGEVIYRGTKVLTKRKSSRGKKK